jgi:hypothetical protein
MCKYEIVKSEIFRDVLVKTDNEGKVWSIPIDETNADYQAYLESLNEVKADEAKTK